MLACSPHEFHLPGGDDFYEWYFNLLFACSIMYLTRTPLRFLGPRMIYTSGIVTDLDREQTLEELQDNKLTVVCEKVCSLLPRFK